MNYKFFLMVLMQYLCLSASESSNSQAPQTVLAYGRAISWLRSSQNKRVPSEGRDCSKKNGFENTDEQHSSDEQYSSDIDKLVRGLLSRVEELELREELKDAFYKEKINDLIERGNRQSRRIALLEKDFSLAREFIDVIVEDSFKKFYLRIQKDMKGISHRIDRNKDILTLQILEIQQQMQEKRDLSLAPSSTPATARGSSGDIKK